MGDRQQREGDRGLAAVQPVRAGHREHRGLHVLGAFTAREQQLADAQGQVEHAAHGGPGLAVLVHGLGDGPDVDRHAQHGAHAVLPGRFLHQGDGDAPAGGVGGRGVLRAVGRRGCERGALGFGGRGGEPGRHGELRGRLFLVDRFRLHSGGGAKALCASSDFGFRSSVPPDPSASATRPPVPDQPGYQYAEPVRPQRNHMTNGRHPLGEGVPPVVCHGAAGAPAVSRAERTQWWPPCASRRLYEASISASASARPTQSAPSTDLPGSRSL